jgi:hypothetical protein
MWNECQFYFTTEALILATCPLIQNTTIMKWSMISNPSDSLHVFHLMEGNNVKEKLLYNPLQQSARISCQGKQRLFFIEQSGLWNNHSVIKNEYGLDIGKFSFDKLNSKAGNIEIENRKFDYSLENTPGAELAIYQKEFIKPIITCGLNAGQSQHKSAHNRESIHEYACLLLGLCWYLFQPGSGEVVYKNDDALVMA